MTTRTTKDTANTATAAAEPMSGGEAAAYQRLRAHLDVLRLSAAAGSLSTVLDAARAEDLSLIAAMERLLAVESILPNELLRTNTSAKSRAGPVERR